ncbi:hypothetical protein WQ57_10105 [Mesobacillus campisalis]|uniref:Major facilitator superfamily (MFS) profile domain-containing protein n=2 Tax=Mesobacillus campisalis TaxID=1408103 RepID=A0A0M2SZX6_9BACI|nr:hypothetical protein WQ57_10105 [Mesobacillus campisalis]
MRFLGVALGPPVFAILQGFSHKTLFLTVTSISVGAALLALFFIKPPKPREDQNGLFEKLDW